MQKILVLSALCLSFAAPAFAQTTPFPPTTATEKAMTPTMEQCKAGYKDEYMQSMKWSKATFDDACTKVMKK